MYLLTAHLNWDPHISKSLLVASGCPPSSAGLKQLPTSESTQKRFVNDDRLKRHTRTRGTYGGTPFYEVLQQAKLI